MAMVVVVEREEEKRVCVSNFVIDEVTASQKTVGESPRVTMNEWPKIAYSLK